MKYLPRFSSLLRLALASFLTATLHAEDLKAVTWNIEWYPGGRPNASRAERKKQVEGVEKILAEMNPDIFLAQEVTDEKAFADLVATIPGMHVNVFTKFLEPNSDKIGPQQCTIASKLKANSAWFEEFKPTEDLPNLRRGFAFAALEHPDGGLIMLYSVHLKSNRGSDTPEGEKDVANTRKESVKQLIAHKKAMEKKFEAQKIVGWVIAGDFNTNDDGQFPMCTVVKDLLAAGFHNTWDATPKEERLTWRNNPKDTRFNPTTFDYIMTTGFKEAQAKMIKDIPIDISDHAAVEVMLSTK